MDTINENYVNFPPESNNSIDCFEDKYERKKFIKKTLSLFFMGILSTFNSCLLFKYVPNSIYFVQTEICKVITILTLVTTTTTILITICFDNLLRKKPINYIIYILFVLSLSWNVGISTSYFSNDVILASIGTTCGISFILLMYTITTQLDFTDYTEYILVILFGIIFMSIINYFLLNTVLQIIISGLGSILFSFLIVMDLQMIVAQKHIKYKYYLEDYVLASLSLYLDVINLFLYLIQLISFSDN